VHMWLLNLFFSCTIFPPLLFITLSTLYGGEWSVSWPVCFVPGERDSCTYSIVGWWSLGVCLNILEQRKKLLHLVRIKPQFLSFFTKNILFLFAYNLNQANWSWRSGSVANIMVGSITCHLLLPPALLAIIIIIPPLTSHFVMAGIPLFFLTHSYLYVYP